MPHNEDIAKQPCCLTTSGSSQLYFGCFFNSLGSSNLFLDMHKALLQSSISTGQHSGSICFGVDFYIGISYLQIM